MEFLDTVAIQPQTTTTTTTTTYNNMKLTQNKKLKPGMTLIELTVVIIVLLTLITVLFFAGTAYIKASNRTACLANQATIHKGVRGYQSLKQKDTTDTLTIADVSSDGYLGDTTKMLCPTNDASYSITANFPAQGVRAAICGDGTYGGAAGDAFVAGADPELHIPKDYSNW